MKILENRFVYILSKIIFKWSLIYFFVFIFLEDLKRSFVSSHFIPHLLLPVIFFFGIIFFVISHNEKYFLQNKNSIFMQKKDFVYLTILSLLSGLLIVSKLTNFYFFWRLFFGLITAIIIFIVSYQLFKALYD